MENTKTCSKCGRELPLECFGKHKCRKDGLQPYCKECQKQYRADNAEYFKQWYTDNRAEQIEKMKQYYTANREHELERNKQYRGTIEGYARQIRHANLQNDRKYGRCGKDEDPLPTIEQYIKLLQQPDYYDGKQYHWSEMGLDRIDNSKSHTIDNVLPATTEHNRQRGRKSFEEFCELIKD